MSVSSGRGRLAPAAWVLAGLAAACTAAVLFGAARRLAVSEETGVPAGTEGSIPEREIAARVGTSVLYIEDMGLMGMEPDFISVWVEDEMLASLALERGLENPRKSGLLGHRARQLYLRDEILAATYSRIPFPDDEEVFEFMRADSALYLVERQYLEILLADSAIADSIHGRLLRGDSFHQTAERLSLGQKGGIGGELGFLTAGELIAYGVPRQAALGEGLGHPVESPYGWHILLVDGTRPLEDTARVMRSVADDLHRRRTAEARDSLLRAAAALGEVEINPRFAAGTGRPGAERENDETDGGQE